MKEEEAEREKCADEVVGCEGMIELAFEDPPGDQSSVQE